MKAKFLALAALLFGLAACQTDPQGLDVTTGGEQEVMLTVSLPEVTRANSAQGFDLTTLGSNYDIRYILEIYRVENNVVLYDNCQHFVDTSDGTSMVFPVRLAPGYDYRIVAWADIVEEGSEADRYYYTEDGLDNVVIKDNGTVNWNAMDETRDAYTATKLIEDFNSSSDLDMELTRPFAKVRVVATDIDDIRNVGLEPTTATVEYSQNMYVKYNAVEDKCIEDGAKMKKHEFAYDDVATEYNDATGEMTLFTDYIFVPSTGTAKFNFVVKDANGNEIKTNNFNTDIFVESNKLTTIKGDVLTTGGNVTIKVENGLGEKETYTYVDNAEDLQQMINNAPENENTNITLGGDIDLNDLLGAGILSTRAAEPTYGLLIPAGKELTLDLNGFTISQTKTQTGKYALIENNGTLTLCNSAEKNGTISYGDNAKLTADVGYASNTIQNNGTLTINDGVTLLNTSGTEVASYGYPHVIDTNGKLTINGGILTNEADYSTMRIWCTTDDDTIVTIDGGTFNGSIDFQTPSASANKGTLTIKGGTFNADTYTKCAVRLLGFGADVDEMNGYILGGHFNGAIALRNWSGSELNSKVFNITGGTFTVDPSEFVNDDYTVVEAEGLWTLQRKPDVAKIGEVGYTTLAKAVAAVEDGGTITLVANEVFTETNRYNNGGYWDGLGYSGDKSFTIDLNSKTIGQDGALNDYLIWVKNDGAKANTITIKNGTLDAGTTAYCAFATASSNKQKITINLENIELKGNNSNGAVAKIRGGAELNVKAGTVINGLNNYVGIECVNSTTNIYEGAKIYQKGTSSSWGCLVGVSNNGVVNVYGGNGTSARGGFIAMTSGGTINVYGGEWIANTDGTYANDNNSVLVAQSANGKKSIINVTGGTFKGGYNCYGDAAGDAQLNIKGGNFNADPASYVVDGYKVVEANGVYTVAMDPVAKIGETEYATLQEAFNVGGDITLLRDVTVAEPVVLAEGKTAVLDLNGKTLAAANVESTYAINNLGTLTIKGNGTVNARGIYNGYGNGGENVASAKLTIENGTFNAKGTNGGACVYNYGVVEVKGGKFESNGGYGLNNQSGASITITGGEIRGGIYNCGTLSVDGENTSLYQHLSGKHAIYNWSATAIINNGAFDSESGNELILADGENSSVTINGGTFDKTAKSWLMGAATGKNITFVVNGGTFRGYVNMPEMTVDTFRPYNDPIVVCGGNFNFNPTQWLSDGYIAFKNNDETYTVKSSTLEDGAVLDLGGVEYNGTITALGDLTIKGDTKIKTLKAVNGGTITIEDGKTLTLNNFSFGSKDTANAEYEIKGGKIVASYGFFQHGKYTLRSNFETGYMYYSYGSDITVYGTFHSQGKGDGLDYVRGKLTIADGGKSIHDKSLWVGQPASWGEMNASLVIEAGGYVQANSLSVYEGSSLTYSNDADLKYNNVTGTEYITKK